MAIEDLPEPPDLDQFDDQARELHRGVRAGDAGSLRQAGLTDADAAFSLARAQLVIARRYGFASWERLTHHVEAINARTWVLTAPPPDESLADQLLRLACLNYGSDDPANWTAARELLDAHPDLPSSEVCVAAVSGDLDSVRRHLSVDPAAANEPAGPYLWSPLMYLGYSRLAVPLEATLAVATLLIDAGADVNDGRFFGGFVTPFTVLTGIFGGGEQDPPPHPHAIPLARLLLNRGADPHDEQTLYNRMFRADDDFLELLIDFGLGASDSAADGAGDGGPWRRLLPDLLQSPMEAVRDLLEWAVMHDQRDRVRLLAAQGVDVASPISDGKTPIDVAAANGLTAMTDLLRGFGATPSALDPVEAFVGAALAGNTSAIAATPTEVIDAAKAQRPALVVWATAQQRPDAVRLLVGLGFDINAFGRADVPLDQPWQTALHTAVERGDAELLRVVLELGGDPSLRDQRFNGTPLNWCDHFNRPDLRVILGG